MSRDSLTSEDFGGVQKVSTAKRVRSLQWGTLHVCNACYTGYVRKSVFLKHIKRCVGGYVSNVIFDAIPAIEYFNDQEYKYTLKTPVIQSIDIETCNFTGFDRRINKKGKVSASETDKQSQKIVVEMTSATYIRPRPDLNFTFYKDVSMFDEELMDFGTVPFDIRKHIDVEDYADVEGSIENFRNEMNEFMKLKSIHLEKEKEQFESPEDEDERSSEIEAIRKHINKKREHVAIRCLCEV